MLSSYSQKAQLRLVTHALNPIWPSAPNDWTPVNEATLATTTDISEDSWPMSVNLRARSGLRARGSGPAPLTVIGRKRSLKVRRSRLALVLRSLSGDATPNFLWRTICWRRGNLPNRIFSPLSRSKSHFKRIILNWHPSKKSIEWWCVNKFSRRLKVFNRLDSSNWPAKYLWIDKSPV